MSRAWTLPLGIVCALFAALAPPATAAGDPQPDLVVKKLTATHQASPVSQLLVTAKVANAGGDMSGKGKLKVKLSDAGNQLAQAKSGLPAIDGGKKRRLSLNLAVPDGVGGGTYDLKACGKAPKGTKDADKTNNCKTVSPVEIPKPASEPDPDPGPSPDPDPGPLPDTTAPETTITSGPAEGAEDRNFEVSFAFASSEGGSSFECRVDAGSFQPCSSPKSVFVTFDGSRSFAVRAIDAAGNVDPTPATRTWIANARIELASFELDQSCIYHEGQNNVAVGTVTLDRPAEGETFVTVSSASPSVVVTGGGAAIPDGAASAQVQASISGSGSATLTAQLGATTIQRTLEVRPIGSPLAIERLTMTPNSVAAGQQSTATVVLDCIAPAGGTQVALSADDPSISFEPSATPTVPEDQRSVAVDVQTTQSGVFVITATLGTSAKDAGLNVTP